jgi:hypothetical protein
MFFGGRPQNISILEHGGAFRPCFFPGLTDVWALGTFLNAATRKEALLSRGPYPHVNLRTDSKIDTRVRYLTPSEPEAWKSANQHIPKRRFSKRYQHRARQRLQSMFKLLITPGEVPLL